MATLRILASIRAYAERTTSVVRVLGLMRVRLASRFTSMANMLLDVDFEPMVALKGISRSSTRDILHLLLVLGVSTTTFGAALAGLASLVCPILFPVWISLGAMLGSIGFLVGSASITVAWISKRREAKDGLRATSCSHNSVAETIDRERMTQSSVNAAGHCILALLRRMRSTGDDLVALSGLLDERQDSIDADRRARSPKHNSEYTTPVRVNYTVPAPTSLRSVAKGGEKHHNSTSADLLERDFVPQWDAADQVQRAQYWWLQRTEELLSRFPSGQADKLCSQAFDVLEQLNKVHPLRVRHISDLLQNGTLRKDEDRISRLLLHPEELMANGSGDFSSVFQTPSTDSIGSDSAGHKKLNSSGDQYSVRPEPFSYTDRIPLIERLKLALRQRRDDKYGDDSNEHSDRLWSDWLPVMKELERRHSPRLRHLVDLYETGSTESDRQIMHYLSSNPRALLNDGIYDDGNRQFQILPPSILAADQECPLGFSADTLQNGQARGHQAIAFDEDNELKGQACQTDASYLVGIRGAQYEDSLRDTEYTDLSLQPQFSSCDVQRPGLEACSPVWQMDSICPSLDFGAAPLAIQDSLANGNTLGVSPRPEKSSVGETGLAPEALEYRTTACASGGDHHVQSLLAVAWTAIKMSLDAFCEELHPTPSPVFNCPLHHQAAESDPIPALGLGEEEGDRDEFAISMAERPAKAERKDSGLYRAPGPTCRSSTEHEPATPDRCFSETPRSARSSRRRKRKIVKIPVEGEKPGLADPFGIDHSFSPEIATAMDIVNDTIGAVPTFTDVGDGSPLDTFAQHSSLNPRSGCTSPDQGTCKIEQNGNADELLFLGESRNSTATGVPEKSDALQVFPPQVLEHHVPAFSPRNLSRNTMPSTRTSLSNLLEYTHADSDDRKFCSIKDSHCVAMAVEFPEEPDPSQHINGAPLRSYRVQPPRMRLKRRKAGNSTAENISPNAPKVIYVHGLETAKSEIDSNVEFAEEDHGSCYSPASELSSTSPKVPHPPSENAQHHGANEKNQSKHLTAFRPIAGSLGLFKSDRGCGSPVSSSAIAKEYLESTSSGPLSSESSAMIAVSSCTAVTKSEMEETCLELARHGPTSPTSNDIGERMTTLVFDSPPKPPHSPSAAPLPPTHRGRSPPPASWHAALEPRPLAETDTTVDSGDQSDSVSVSTSSSERARKTVNLQSTGWTPLASKSTASIGFSAGQSMKGKMSLREAVSPTLQNDSQQLQASAGQHGGTLADNEDSGQTTEPPKVHQSPHKLKGILKNPRGSIKHHHEGPYISDWEKRRTSLNREQDLRPLTKLCSGSSQGRPALRAQTSKCEPRSRDSIPGSVPRRTRFGSTDIAPESEAEEVRAIVDTVRDWS